MIPTVIDPSLYFLFRSGEFIGVNGSYVDDLSRAGNNQYKSILNCTLERFEASGNEDVPITSAGIHTEYFPECTYTID